MSVPEFVAGLALEDLHADYLAAERLCTEARQEWERLQTVQNDAHKKYRAALLASRTDTLPVGALLRFADRGKVRLSRYGRIQSVGLMAAHEDKLVYTVAVCTSWGVELPGQTATVSAFQEFKVIPDPLAQVQP